MDGVSKIVVARVEVVRAREGERKRERKRKEKGESTEIRPAREIGQDRVDSGSTRRSPRKGKGTLVSKRKEEGKLLDSTICFPRRVGGRSDIHVRYLSVMPRFLFSKGDLGGADDSD